MCMSYLCLLPAVSDMLVRKMGAFDECELRIDILGSLANKFIRIIDKMETRDVDRK